MTPTKPTDFIGKTGLIAKVMFAKGEAFKRDERLPAIDRRYIFTGPAGTGKTALAMAVAAAITGNSIQSILDRNSLNVEWTNGQSTSVELVRQWRDNGRYLPLYGSRIVQIVDEFDLMSPAATAEWLSYCDALPWHTLFIATTNKQISELPDRVQSRAKVHRFEVVSTQTIADWLSTHFNLTPDKAGEIAEASNGNVRAAETDALSHVEVMEALAV